jgi:hypothetical protein
LGNKRWRTKAFKREFKPGAALLGPSPLRPVPLEPSCIVLKWQGASVIRRHSPIELMLMGNAREVAGKQF